MQSRGVVKIVTLGFLYIYNYGKELRHEIKSNSMKLFLSCQKFLHSILLFRHQCQAVFKISAQGPPLLEDFSDSSRISWVLFTLTAVPNDQSIYLIPQLLLLLPRLPSSLDCEVLLQGRDSALFVSAVNCPGQSLVHRGNSIKPGD